jgi:hypothetical protein
MTVIPIVSHQNTVSAVPTTLTTRTTPPASCPTSNSRPYNPYNRYNPTCRLYFLALTTIVAGLSAACHPPAAARHDRLYRSHQLHRSFHAYRLDRLFCQSATGPPAARHGPASRSPRARQPLATGPPAARHGPASRSPRARPYDIPPARQPLATGPPAALILW